jgi:hypothetical protein
LRPEDSLLGVGYSPVCFEPQNVEQGMLNDEVLDSFGLLPSFETRKASGADFQLDSRRRFGLG